MQQGNEPLLALSETVVGYRNRDGKRDLTTPLHLSLYRGEFVCVIGPNGCGKSTLLRTALGLQPPLSGSITVTGKNVHQLSPPERARLFAAVLTDHATSGRTTTEELAELGRHPYTGWFGTLTPEDRDVVESALSWLELEPLRHRTLDSLSDGERQRAYLARAVAQQTPLVLLDEPTAYLDVTARAETVHRLLRLAHEGERAVLMSTHDLELALRTADTIWLFTTEIEDGRRSVATGAPEDIVLSGLLERTLGGGEVRFDRATGSFSVVSETGARILIEGTEERLRWAARAAARAGFTPIASKNAAETGEISAQYEGNEALPPRSGSISPGRPEIKLSAGADGNWLLSYHNRNKQYETLGQVVRALRALRQAELNPERQ